MPSSDFNNAFQQWQSPLDLGKIAPSIASTQALTMGDAGQIPGMGGGMADLSGIAGGGEGMNFMEGAKLGLGGLQSLAQLWMGFQANKLAREQFKFTKETTNTNLANQMKSYNTAMEDRIRSRSHTEGRADGYADNYMSKHRLERQTP